MAFINSFKGLESHYCRARTGRIYLPSDLSIKQMWVMYQNQVEQESLRVRESYFRGVFVKKYNISFKSPSSDKCSKCTELDYKIKAASNSNQKEALMTEIKLHKLKAKSFYNLLGANKDHTILVLSFDCQKNQVLLKVPDQAAYYSRQIYIYNFTIVEGSSKSGLCDTNVNIYYWTENLYKKGSNEIASALHHKLRSIENNGNIRTVRLFADGCSGQNKNSTMIALCSSWLGSAPENFQKVEIIFPVVGHSFLPPDRVFGLIERQIRKHEVMIQPDEYVKIFKKFGQTFELGQDVEVKNWKVAAASVLKVCSSWHFKFKESKRIIIYRLNGKITVQGELHYSSDIGVRKSLFKKLKNFKDINPTLIRPGVQINELKLNDVVHLLEKHFGSNWSERPDIEFYNNLKNTMSTDQEELEEISEFEDDEPSFRI